MASRKIFFLLLAAGCWLLASQCAQIVNPNGGKKDVKPPHAIKYFPDSAKTNFSGKNIVIAFDEYIQLNDLQKQLVISPPMTMLPEIRVKGKTLLIELKDSLKKNTTYTFNFGNAIRDITESNPVDNFQYIFSTGNFIDSLCLKGAIKNAFDQKTDKGILVMLYSDLSDSVPYRKLPSYFAKTNAGGVYKINNIRAGTYKVFALKDANNNYLYDLPAEQIAFSDTLLNIKKNTTLNLSLFQEEPKKQKLKKAVFVEHGHIVFAFAKPADSVKLKFISPEPKQNVIYEYSKEKDTLHYWFAEDLKDTLKIKLVDGNKILDTVKLRPITLEMATKSSRGVKWGLSVTSNVRRDNLFDIKNPLVLIFSHPFNFQFNDFTKQIDDSLRKLSHKIIIHEDSIIMNKDSTTTLYSYRELKMKKNTHWKENSSYRVFIPPATFTDIFGLTNDTIKFDFKTQEEKYYGTLKLALKMKIRIAYILQLMNEKGEVFNFIDSDKGVFSYKYLPPGSYKLRIIYDKNGDGKWTTGDYLSRKKPETVIYYPSSITIRSNWDLELDWKVE